jgi:hypothetical protein
VRIGADNIVIRLESGFTGPKVGRVQEIEAQLSTGLRPFFNVSPSLGFSCLGFFAYRQTLFPQPSQRAILKPYSSQSAETGCRHVLVLRVHRHLPVARYVHIGRGLRFGVGRNPI